MTIYDVVPIMNNILCLFLELLYFNIMYCSEFMFRMYYYDVVERWLAVSATIRDVVEVINMKIVIISRILRMNLLALDYIIII